MDFVERIYWEQQSNKTKFELAQKHELIPKLIYKWVKPTTYKSAFEIGCFPGRFLGILGKLGYQLNGIDVLQDSIEQMKTWFRELNFNIGEITNQPIEEFVTDRKFDVVCSFGFIEHYADFLGILEKHATLVESDGILLITTPNYKGWLQNFLHRFLDRENLERHNIASMQPCVWAGHLESLGFEILYQGYFGYFSFWVEEMDKRNAFKKWLSNAIIKSLPITSRLLPNNLKATSPFCGLVARRK